MYDCRSNIFKYYDQELGKYVFLNDKDNSWYNDNNRDIAKKIAPSITMINVYENKREDEWETSVDVVWDKTTQNGKIESNILSKLQKLIVNNITSDKYKKARYAALVWTINVQFMNIPENDGDVNNIYALLIDIANNGCDIDIVKGIVSNSFLQSTGTCTKAKKILDYIDQFNNAYEQDTKKNRGTENCLIVMLNFSILKNLSIEEIYKIIECAAKYYHRNNKKEFSEHIDKVNRVNFYKEPLGKGRMNNTEANNDIDNIFARDKKDTMMNDLCSLVGMMLLMIIIVGAIGLSKLNIIEI
ncbi:hypothetical protein OCOL_001578 [Ordospora colligata]